MENIVKFRNFFLSLFVIIFTFSFTAASNAQGRKIKMRVGTRVIKLNEIGKPGSGTRLVKDEALTNRIMAAAESSPKSHRVSAEGEPPMSDSPVNAALVEDPFFGSLDFTGHLSGETVMVISLQYVNKKPIRVTFRVEEEGDYSFVLVNGELDPFLTLDEYPSLLKVAGFDESTGDFFSLTSDLDYYNTSCGEGIVDVERNSDGIYIVGSFDRPQVWINWTQVPSDQIDVAGEEGITVFGGFNAESGEPLLYPGYNLITVVNGDGACDTAAYRHKPYSCEDSQPEAN